MKIHNPRMVEMTQAIGTQAWGAEFKSQFLCKKTHTVGSQNLRVGYADTIILGAPWPASLC